MKIQSPNAKCFWHEIKRMQGLVGHTEKITLQHNNSEILDSTSLANCFASFFESKVQQLSNDTQPYQWMRSMNHVQFNEADLKRALKTYKKKLSSGPDGIPMKLIKDLTEFLMPETLALMNQAASSGMPQCWKSALVRPLHKKGNKTEVSNYRPISNLDSISKLYEKLLLQKMDDLIPDIEGDHQHGFRSNRSTVTALIDLQETIASALDMKKEVATYSIDMSAAFDLLKPNIFHNIDLPETLMNPLMDFMTNRTFTVEVEGKRSSLKYLNVGCVQGSVLGPRLFAIYCKELIAHLPEANVVSYADDAYVTLTATTKQELISKVENSIESHQKYMSSIGMVINKDKTELIKFSRKGDEIIELPNAKITSRKHMKALGVTISSDLSWDEHITNVINKTSYTIRLIKHLGTWLKTEDLLKIVTSKYFGITYYASPVWMTPDIGNKNWTKLMRQHYKALRAAYKDRAFKFRRRELDSMSKRATPVQWGCYSTAKCAIGLMRKNNTRIAHCLNANVYTNDRLPGKARFSDKSKMKVGRQSIVNRLTFMNSIDFPWYKTEISDDQLRINLKRTFIQTDQ